MAATASICGGRSTIVRTILRAAQSTATRSPSPSIRSDFGLRLSPSLRSRSANPRLLRRELSSLLPVHSAIASSCLVSKLTCDGTFSEGRFANYVSPI